MPDFFKKMKRKAEKKRMTGERNSSKETPQRRRRFLPLQASTTSIFCRRKAGQPSESEGKCKFSSSSGSDYSSMCFSDVLFAVVSYRFSLNGVMGTHP